MVNLLHDRFSGGVGLDQTQRIQGTNDFRRFFDGKGIDVFKNTDDGGKAYNIELLNETAMFKTGSNANQHIIAHEMFIYAGDNIYYSSNSGDT